MACRRRPLILLAVGALLVAASCTARNDGATPPTPSTSTSRPAASVLVDPDEFARRVEDPKVVTINVHVPTEGNIPGTDLTIPFDQISRSTELPTDLATPLAAYCRSGNMSATAVEDLRAKGYEHIVELQGGYDAWLRSGRTLDRS
jgi:rhodanese-related sulfurtransferase